MAMGMLSIIFESELRMGTFLRKFDRHSDGRLNQESGRCMLWAEGAGQFGLLGSWISPPPATLDFPPGRRRVPNASGIDNRVGERSDLRCRVSVRRSWECGSTT
jgi:hypothetical protein